MKGNGCGFLHQFDKSRMPTCRFFAKYNECKEPDCPFKHSLEDIKDCNMFKLGFCIHGPNCRYRHSVSEGILPAAGESALIGRPGNLHGAQSHMQRFQMSLTRGQDVLDKGQPAEIVPPPLPPGPPPSNARVTQQLLPLSWSPSEK